jgi:hypothetical protein
VQVEDEFVPVWPEITEPELLERLATDDEELVSTAASLLLQVPPRTYEPSVLERAIGYPWSRPTSSYLLTDGAVRTLDDIATDERGSTTARFLSSQDGEQRVRLLAFGSNGSPDTLTQKFAHFPDEADRTVLVLAGELRDFDVGAAAQPTLYGSMAATLFPSPGASVRAAVLVVTPTQFTQLAWSELTYRLGWLETTFDADETELSLDGALAFVSRWGAFCVEGRPVAMEAIPATGRTAAALSQEELLDAAAELSMGPGATSEALVRAIFENAGDAFRLAAPVRAASQPFVSDRWTLFPPPST